ncbi:replication initiation and membrane attachment family protein [Amphibacillus marinus]|nr:DnaD domain protein [Amphibacillus marinus]
MHQSIGKLLPSDGYQIIGSYVLQADHYQAIYQLYQPIIGMHATALYMTLIHIPSSKQLASHHYLMQLLNQPLTEIYQARLKCEAIGLIRTYQKDTDNDTVYQYSLNYPSIPADFLADDLLSQLLYHQIGEDKFNVLAGLYQDSANAKLQVGQEVTVPFTEVFQNSYLGLRQSDQAVTFDSQSKGATPQLSKDSVDWSWLEQSLAARMLPLNKVLSEHNRKLIQQMVALYQLSNTQVEKAIQWSVTSEHELDREEFKQVCFDLVGTVISGSLSYNRREKAMITPVDSEKSKQDQFIERMEAISPKELLEDLANGNQAASQDLKMIATIMDNQGLNPGVMNVLIHYVMLKSDMKLSKSYLEKIASHWARKNVKTVQQAMTLAKSEHKKYQGWHTGKPTTKNYSKSNGRKEIVPDWFKKQKQEQAKQPAELKSGSGVNAAELLAAFNSKKN